MDQQLEQIIREAYSKLPDDMKQALATLPVLKIMEEVAAKNGLHIDQAGDLYTETILVLLGIEKVGSFVSNVRKALDISFSSAEKIAIDINEKVFLSIRASLQAIHTEENEKAELNRDQILSEIENPQPVAEMTPAETNQAIANDFIGSKLTQTVALPSQQTTVPLSKPESKPKSYTSDPYRESID